MIPWANPRAQYRAHEAAIRAAVTRVLESGTYVLGAEVETFERAFAEYCGAAVAVGVGSGTDALTLALKSLGIGPDDEVITVSHTALATVAAVLAANAVPVLVDVDPQTATIDPAKIEGAVTPRTKAIVPVHLYGQPADMTAVRAVAGQRGLKVAEDCAQAAGARHQGARVGSLGDIACFSFYPTKNLGAIGDGGMIVTSDADLAARARRLRQYGWDGVRATEEAGLNSRLDPLQAAILGVKLTSLDADNARRVAIARRYGEGLSGLPLSLPAAASGTEHIFHLYVVETDARDALMKHLAGKGVGTAIHYPVPAHRHRGYAEKVVLPSGGLPETERLAGRILSLPIYPELGDPDVDAVIAAVRSFYGR